MKCIKIPANEKIRNYKIIRERPPRGCGKVDINQ